VNILPFPSDVFSTKYFYIEGKISALEDLYIEKKTFYEKHIVILKDPLSPQGSSIPSLQRYPKSIYPPNSNGLTGNQSMVCSFQPQGPHCGSVG
jgi:hypothetical protein